MPELPELEICRRQLSRWGAGRTLTDVEIPDPTSIRTRLSSRPSDADRDGESRLRRLVGGRPKTAIRHGKRVAWPWDSHALLIQLGMTGRWVRREARDRVPRHGRLGLVFGQHTLWLTDARRFGCVCVIPADDLALAVRGNLGPDALLEPLEGPDLRRQFGGRRAIKVALLDQTTIAGIGNIQAAEALFRARIDPSTPVNTLSVEAWERLSRALPEQLQWTLDHSDAEEISYSTDAGADNPFLIYGRQGEDCPRCGTAISKAVMGGRSTFWCPTCQ